MIARAKLPAADSAWSTRFQLTLRSRRGESAANGFPLPQLARWRVTPPSCSGPARTDPLPYGFQTSRRDVPEVLSRTGETCVTRSLAVATHLEGVADLALGLGDGEG